MGKPLKNKRFEMFCRHYVTEIDGKLYHATKAAIKAGYSVKTAYSQGSRLLKRVEIQERINDLKREAFDKLELDQLFVLSKYKKIVTDDISNYLEYEPIEITYVDSEGEEQTRHDINVNIKASNGIDTWNVTEVSKGKDGQFKFKLHSKDDALAKIADLIGYTDEFERKLKQQKADLDRERFEFDKKIKEKGDGSEDLTASLQHIKTVADYVNNPQPNRSLDDE